MPLLQWLQPGWDRGLFLSYCLELETHFLEAPRGRRGAAVEVRVSDSVVLRGLEDGARQHSLCRGGSQKLDHPHDRFLAAANPLEPVDGQANDTVALAGDQADLVAQTWVARVAPAKELRIARGTHDRWGNLLLPVAIPGGRITVAPGPDLRP